MIVILKVVLKINIENNTNGTNDLTNVMIDSVRSVDPYTIPSITPNILIILIILINVLAIFITLSRFVIVALNYYLDKQTFLNDLNANLICYSLICVNVIIIIS